MPRLLLVALLGASTIVAACDPAAVASQDPPSASTGTPGPTTSAVPGSASAQNWPISVDTLPPLAVDLRTITRVCAVRPASSGNAPRVIDCGDATVAALRLLGPASRSVVRTEFRYDRDCGPYDGCGAPPDPLIGVVFVAYVSAAPVAISVTADETLSVSVFAPQPLNSAGWQRPPFVAPEPAALQVGVDPPAYVRERDPLPHCGVEDTRLPDASTDGTARECFTRAVLAGERAEFIELTSTSEGDPIASIARYLGRGGIDVMLDQSQDRSSSVGWTRSQCALLLLGDGTSFAASNCVEGPP